MRESCPRQQRDIESAARLLPVWSTNGPGPVVILVWGPILLVEPAVDAAERQPSWPAWLLCLAILAAFSGAVTAAYGTGRHGRLLVPAALAVQAALSLTAAVLFGSRWYALFILLAVALGAVAPPRFAPRAILLLTAVGSITVWWPDHDWTQTWSTALTTFLAGFGTYSFHRLLSVIAELNATRQELALKAVDQERLRFSRDLHDLLGHTLSVIVVKAEAIRRLLPPDVEAAAGHARDVETIGRQALVEVRQAVSGYRDADVARELDRAEIAFAAAGIDLQIDNTSPPLPPPIDALFGWVVREGTTNVIRHAGARRCRITLRSDAQRHRLSIVDDGRGAAAASSGEGIRGLAERAAAVGGSLEIDHSPKGFALSVNVPSSHDRAAS